jgi:hypothetical protein
MFEDHQQKQIKHGVRIITSNPAQQEIEGQTQRGEVIPISAYTLNPIFRWPRVGEKWIVREENGSWFLESIWEPANGIVPGPGDVVISAPLGRILLNVNGIIQELIPSTFPRVPQPSKFSLVMKGVLSPKKL